MIFGVVRHLNPLNLLPREYEFYQKAALVTAGYFE